MAMEIIDSALYFIEIPMRVPLKFGAQTLTEVSCARVAVRVRGDAGREVVGWGETPLSVGWVWPADLDYDERLRTMKSFCVGIAGAIRNSAAGGHAFEIGHEFIHGPLEQMRDTLNHGREPDGRMPHLAALVCFSAFDIALHDAFGRLCERPVYETYTGEFLRTDLAGYLEPAEGSGISFAGKYPADFLTPRRDCLPVWHLVGGLDPLDEGELTGDEPDDGYPVLLGDWIRRDGLNCLKVKLRGNDEDWDFERLVKVAAIARGEGAEWLSADFNCTVTDPEYVNAILDRMKADHREVFDSILYVEQPFPYDLERHRIDVSGVSARKPLYMDESAHDWTYVRIGRELGWTGVALKTCKTQTGALLSLSWARAHGMGLMVQDLTNPMLAQIPHVLLAAHAGTLMGVESNAMQFYPDASLPEQAVHPGIYRRRKGVLELSTLGGPGFEYRLESIQRQLPDPAVAFER